MTPPISPHTVEDLPRSTVVTTVGTGQHLDPDELRTWTGFVDATRMLEEVVAKHLVVDHSLTHREYEILVRVDGNGGRMRLSRLAQQVVASPAVITQTVDRLANRGLVERQAATEDRRGVDAAITTAGRDVLGASSGPHAAVIRSLLIERVGRERLAVVAEGLQEVAEHLRAHRRGEGCSDAECPVTHYG